MAQKPAAKKALGDDPHFAQAVQNYEAGLRALQEHKYEKAKSLLQKVLSGTSSQFKSPEEHFDFAVSLMNVGDYVGAREHIEKLLKQVPKADYVLYGLAALDCLTGHVEDALKHLDEAIRQNSSLRFQARNDSDFQNLAEDPRFTELLYPDPGAEMPADTSDSEV